MPENQNNRPQRSYGCSFGCGNPYDYIIVSVMDGSTELLCLPCYVRLAADMVNAVTNPEGKEVMRAVAEMGELDQVPMRDAEIAPRGKNAPVGTDDPDLIEAFTSVITEEDLPDDFK